MTDRYRSFVGTPLGGRLAKALGLPRPVPLRRYEPGRSLLDGPALVGVSDGGALGPAVTKVLAGAGVHVETADDPNSRYAALVYDATGVRDIAGLAQVHAFLTGPFRRLRPSGRVLVLGTPPEDATEPAHAAAQRALDGFVRSVGKEARAGGTANLLYVAAGGETSLDATLRFFLSGRSAYVSGQAVRLGPGDTAEPDDPEHPLSGRVALVTGAARGIGAAIAATLARDGAHVVCLDVPAQGDRLSATANEVGGSALQLDITGPDAPDELAAYLRDRHGGVDVVVHNAGITRDKMLVNMGADRWNAVLAVNLDAQLRMNAALLTGGVLRPHARIVCVSSTSGIAGNRGQTNYAASKAGIIGMVRALAPAVAEAGGTVNAVAPGFIETEMTARMPVGMRELGRRINSMNQGGLPRDVAETVAWLAQPGSGGVNGQVVRVCGQSMLGA